MYQPQHFRDDDLPRLHALIDGWSFGTLVVPTGDDAEISHLPFLLDREPAPGRLRAHVARRNAIAGHVAAGARAIAVFAGPHAYVTPRWYTRPDAQVPTWNYVVVHAHGRLAPLARDELRAVVTDLTARHEPAATPDRPGEPPWSLDRLDPAKVDALLDEIVGFALVVERFEGKRKLSQNRMPPDRAGVRQGLRGRGDPDDLLLADWMEEA
jgi:transcriptional regulator